MMESLERYFEDVCRFIPTVTPVPSFDPTGDYAGIRAVVYDAPDGKKTFAYMGMPKTDAETVPAVVLIHGGGGHAYPEWVRRWNARGYAAIAMDTVGFYPKSVYNGGHDIYGGDAWQYGAWGVFSEDSLSPDNDELSTKALPAEQQWMYHALTKVLLAGNILRNTKGVDKVGICGISWGSVLTALAIGYDPRFAFAVPIYGSGYLNEDLGRLGDCFGSGADMWLAQKRFSKVNMPVLWLCWNDDASFSINANSKSYLDTVQNNRATRLAIINDMGHSHVSGWAQPEGYLFADSICKGTQPLASFVTQPTGYTFTCETDIPTVAATVYYLTEPMAYAVFEKYGKTRLNMQSEWKTLPCTVQGTTIQGTLPADAHGYYIDATATADGQPYFISSAWIVLQP